eukprot:3720144-Amphidinium_carterae.1
MTARRALTGSLVRPRPPGWGWGGLGLANPDRQTAHVHQTRMSDQVLAPNSLLLAFILEAMCLTHFRSSE